MQAITSTANASSLFGNIGGIVQGVGGILQGRSEDAMGQYNANIYNQNAEAERQSAALTAEQKKRLIKSRLGSQTAIVAASGLKNTGSPLDVALDSMTNSNLDLAIDSYNSKVKATGYESQAKMAKYEGKQKASNYYASAGKSLLTSAADIYKSQREIGGGK